MIEALLMLAAATAAPAKSEDPLIQLERRSWEAWKVQDADFWAHYLSDDHIEMGYSGPASKAAVVGMIRAKICHVASYKLEKMAVRYFSRTSALVTYRSTQDASCGKTKVPAVAWASSLFEKRNGRWVNTYYSHVPEIAPPAP